MSEFSNLCNPEFLETTIFHFIMIELSEPITASYKLGSHNKILTRTTNTDICNPTSLLKPPGPFLSDKKLNGNVCSQEKRSADPFQKH